VRNGPRKIEAQLLKRPGARDRFVFRIMPTLNPETSPGSSLDGSGTGKNEPGASLAILRTGKALPGSAGAPRN